MPNVPAPVAPAPVQQQIPVPQPQGQVAPDQEVDLTSLLHQDGYTSTKAQSAKDTALCPECDSPNYLAAKGHPNAMKQCFNCGYNPRFEQSMAGASGIGQKNLPVHTARAQTLSENNFNPGTLVGRVQ
jgi:hypothetical protein